MNALADRSARTAARLSGVGFCTRIDDTMDRDGTVGRRCRDLTPGRRPDRHAWGGAREGTMADDDDAPAEGEWVPWNEIGRLLPDQCYWGQQKAALAKIGELALALDSERRAPRRELDREDDPAAMTAVGDTLWRYELMTSDAEDLGRKVWAAVLRIWSDVRPLLLSWKLEAAGRRGTHEAPLMAIPPHYWRAATIAPPPTERVPHPYQRWRDSQVVMHGELWHDVHVRRRAAFGSGLGLPGGYVPLTADGSLGSIADASQQQPSGAPSKVEVVNWPVAFTASSGAPAEPARRGDAAARVAKKSGKRPYRPPAYAEEYRRAKSDPDLPRRMSIRQHMMIWADSREDIMLPNRKKPGKDWHDECLKELHEGGGYFAENPKDRETE